MLETGWVLTLKCRKKIGSDMKRTVWVLILKLPVRQLYCGNELIIGISPAFSHYSILMVY
jgi:hypothetical protein